MGDDVECSCGLYLQGLDFTVSEAKKYGIRLILAFVNNYPDYGGRAKYVDWAKQYANKWNAQQDDFYSDGTMRQWYKNHVYVRRSFLKSICFWRSSRSGADQVSNALVYAENLLDRTAVFIKFRGLWNTRK